MLSTLLNIILPVFAVAALGYGFGRWQAPKTDMSFVSRANVIVFCPALVFSSLLNNPVNLARDWTLVGAGALIILLPGLLLLLVRRPPLDRRGFLVAGMFRNTGNIGIPLMMLAYGKEIMGGIILLFVVSNLLEFSLGIFLLTRSKSPWTALRNPIIWAAIVGLIAAPHRERVPEFVMTTANLAGQIAIPLMLFGLGVRLSESHIQNWARAMRVNGMYLFAGLAALPFVLWLLPLPPAWSRLIVLTAVLPPAVINYLLCEHYDVEPKAVASVVLSGNLMALLDEAATRQKSSIVESKM